MLSAIIRWSINNRWIVSLIVALWFFASIYLSSSMPVDVFPDFSPVQVVVMTECPGYAPEEVESLVTRPLESGLNGTANVKIVRSVSTIGLSVITVIFQDGVNIFTARQLVAEKLQSSQASLPRGSGEPALAPITSASGDILKIGLYAEGPTALMKVRELVDWTMKMRLMSVPGVANVVVLGGDVKQYQVLVDPSKLKEYDLTLSAVVEAAALSNSNAAGGVLRSPDREQLVRGLGRVGSVEEIADTVVSSRKGLPVLLKNVADVKIGPRFKIGSAVVDGHEGVVLTIFKQPWANTLATTRLLEQTLTDLEGSLPADVKLVTTFRQADFIDIAIANVAEAIFLGALLVVLVLLLFLQNFRAAMISLTAIPLSLLTAVVVLKLQGLSINTMTLGGLAIAIGEVVDDAIIDVENVYLRLRENKLLGFPETVHKVVFNACSEVRTSVVYATLIVALVFLPVLYLGDLQGKIFAPLAVSYLSALLSSLVVALTVTPALCFLLLKSPSLLPEQETKVLQQLKSLYRPLLKTSIARPKATIALAVLLTLLSVAPLAVMGTEFLPSFDENNLVVVTNYAPGTSIDTTTRMGKGLIGHFLKKHEVLAASQRAGRAEGGEDYGSGNFSEFDIRLKADAPHKKDVLYHVRREFGAIPGLVSDTGSYLQHRMDHALSGVNAAIAIKVFGPDLDELRERAADIEKVLRSVRGAVDVHVESVSAMPQLSIRLNRALAARYGLRVKELSDTIEAAYKGVSVGQVLEGQKSFDLFVSFKEQYRNNADVIKDTLIDTPSGVKAPLSALAEISEGECPNTINHENMSRRVVVQANVAGADLGSVIEEARRKLRSVKLPPGYYLVYGGQFEAQEEASKQLALLTAFALLGMIMLLTIAFKSLRAAVLIMTNLPLALMGGVWAVLFSGAVLSVGSLVGFITLFGISARNGIMLVSHFNDLLSSQVGTFEETIEKSALDRLSPVLMTAVTASLGVLPIALLGGAGRELEQPLAIVILGGMVSSTSLTLLVIPAMLRLFGGDLSPMRRSRK